MIPPGRQDPFQFHCFACDRTEASPKKWDWGGAQHDFSPNCYTLGEIMKDRPEGRHWRAVLVRIVPLYPDLCPPVMCEPKLICPDCFAKVYTKDPTMIRIKEILPEIEGGTTRKILRGFPPSNTISPSVRIGPTDLCCV